MDVLSGFTYSDSINSSLGNAIAMQRLTLYDVTVRRFSNPTFIANPNSYDNIAIQQLKLIRHPERYSGYFQNSQLVAYMKQANWTLADEIPFMNLLVSIPYRVQLTTKRNSPLKQWGVFGLVLDASLSRPLREEILYQLIERSVLHAKAKQCTAVNIILHPYDPVLGAIEFFSFKPVGRRAEVAQVRGRKQRRYQFKIIQS